MLTNRTIAPSDTRLSPFLYRTQSSRSLYSEEHPPPVPPHGLHSTDAVASSPSLYDPFSPTVSQLSLVNPVKPPCPVFDVSELQQPLRDLHLSNGNDSGISSSYIKGSGRGSASSLLRQSADNDLTISMINENKSLRIQ